MSFHLRLHPRALVSAATLAAVWIALISSTANAALRLGSLFKDHMVVQQGVKVPVWGWAQPGQKIKVSIGQNSAKVKTDATGKFVAWLKPVPVGGPYELLVTAADKDSVRVSDVLSGEVWLCSGQSNMQWPVAEAGDPNREIASAAWPQIRMYSVERAYHQTPQNTCVGGWEPATPQFVGHFSATGYYFGRELHRELKVPVGLIHSSWGGTPAESWTTEQTLRAHPDLLPIFDAVAEAKATRDRREKELAPLREKWIQAVAPLRDKDGKLPERHVDIGNTGVDSGWAATACKDSAWQTISLPTPWEKAFKMDVDGAFWFRRTVEIPKAWTGRELKLSLGSLDDFDVTYVNGTKVGATGVETPNYWSTPRLYTVPKALVTGTSCVIAVRVFDHFGGGGFGGQPAEMTLAPSETGTWTPVRVDGVWKYRAERALPTLIPPEGAMGLAPQNEPFVLYNAMIAPLVPYALKGAIWYQGEANAGRAWQYRTLLPAMIADWRKAWAQPQFAFGIVQLANFMERENLPSQSEWAELREAQLMTARADMSAGLTVAIDIGEANDIHPKNKQEVGRRLALWALAKNYGKPVAYSGPTYTSVRIDSTRAVLSFDHVEGGLVCKGDSLTGFSIAGADSQFVWANAKIEGQTVVVWSGKVTKPVAVRYGWANNPACNLSNSSGLPASPFRTDSWAGVTSGKK